MIAPGFDITFTEDPIGFRLGVDCFSYGTERRTFDAIRRSLKDPQCDGPDTVYAIMMDIGKKQDEEDLNRRHLLYGAVCYASGTLGQEPVRSQGHIHAAAPSGVDSTPEVYEIWHGTAIVYMQENGGDDTGRCFAVTGQEGDVILVPPGWVHAAVNADPAQPMCFGAWCVREYGFDYDAVRAHGGIAWFPFFDEAGVLRWEANPAYRQGALIEKTPALYTDFGLRAGIPIYTQYEENRDAFDFVPDPRGIDWKEFTP